MPARRGSSASPLDQEPSLGALKQGDVLRAGPLFVWATLQVLAIGLAACRIPLAAQYPVIGEFHASQLLIAVQLPLAAMLMPVLLTTWRSTVAAASLAGLLQLTASLFTDVPPINSLATVIYITLWVVAMGFVRWSLRDSKALATAGAIGAAMAGGPLLIYFGADLSSRSLDRIVGGPLLPILQDWPGVPLSAWIWLASVICVAFIFRLIFQAFSARSRYNPAPDA
jgi:hypothetical protein